MERLVRVYKEGWFAQKRKNKQGGNPGVYDRKMALPGYPSRARPCGRPLHTLVCLMHRRRASKWNFPKKHRHEYIANGWLVWQFLVWRYNEAVV